MSPPLQQDVAEGDSGTESSSVGVITKIEDLQESLDLAVGEIRKELGSLTFLLRETVERLSLERASVTPLKDSPFCANGFQRTISPLASTEEVLAATSLPPGWPSSVSQRFGSPGRRKRSPRRRTDAASFGMMSNDTSLFSRHDHLTSVMSGTRDNNSSDTSSGGVSISSIWVMDPNSNFHVLWSFLCFMVLMHDLVLTPYFVAFDVELQGFLQSLAWGNVCFWVIDLFISSVTSYHVGDTLEQSPKRVLLKYLRTWCVLDVVMLACDCISMSPMSRTFQLVRLARAGKLLRLGCLLQVTNDFMERCFSEAYRVTLRWLLLFGATLWLLHLISCCWFAIGRLAPSDTGHRWVDKFMLEGEAADFLESSRMYRYFTSMHWSWAQFTLGAIDYECTNSIERMFNIFCLVLGLVFSSALVSLLSASMVDYQMRRLEDTQKLAKLRRFLRQNKVNKNTALLVQRQATQRLNEPEKIKEEDVQALTQISTSLRTELRFELFLPHLNTHPLFRVWVSMDATIVRRLCAEVLVYAFYRPQDDLFTAGMSSGKAYYLADGCLDYIQDPETFPVTSIEVTVITDGSWLSEASLWSNWIHVGTAKARTNCEVLVVPCDAASLVMQRHGDVGEITQVYLEQFHRRIVSAKPPSATWPTDLNVPLTDFGDLVMSMEPELQKVIGLNALEARAQVWQFGRTQPNLGKLRQEITEGKSSVMLNAGGQVERVVSVVVMRLHDSSGRVLAEIGKSEQEDEGRLQPSCQLPGAKQEMGEMASETLKRLIGRFRLEAKSVQVVQTERTEQWKQSKEFGLHTKYLRTEHLAQLHAEDIGVAPLVAKVPSRVALPRAGSVLKLQTSVDPLGEDLVATHAYDVRNGTKRSVYAWLTEQRFEHLGSPAGRRELAAWVDLLSYLRPSEEPFGKMEPIDGDEDTPGFTRLCL